MENKRYMRYKSAMKILDAYDEFRKVFTEVTGVLVECEQISTKLGELAKEIGDTGKKLNDTLFDYVEEVEE